MSLKTVRNPALITLNARTNANVLANAATVSALETQEVTSTPKSTVTAKVAAGLSRDGSQAAFVVFDPLHGVAVSVTADAAKTAVMGAVGWGGGGDLATVIETSVSADGLRGKFMLADDALDAQYNRPEDVEDEDDQELVFAFAPVRPTVAWDKALAMFSNKAEKAGKALAFDQATSQFKTVDSIAKATLLSAIPAPSAEGTFVYDVVEDADTAEQTDVVPRLGN